jgi:hypothetical protein
MRLVVALIGTASPKPIPATAVLTPTTFPLPSERAPPEFPGLRAASVWITFSMIRTVLRFRVGRPRPRALITPAVTDPVKPRGLPTATTSCPTLSVSASPSSACGRSPAPTRTTARSERGSAPITCHSSSRPSTSDAEPPADPETTCAEVRRKPSGVITTALPAPSARRPPGTRLVTRRLATEGMSFSATEVTTRE